MRTIVVATSNRGKAREIARILSEVQVNLLTLEDFPKIKLPPETGSTFEENALAKARYVAGATGHAAIADDSGLEVDFLGSRPGIFSARYAGADATDRENYEKLLGELKGVEEEKRGARFRCAIAYVEPDGTEAAFEGTLEGRIAEFPSGDGGFGYDPVFFVPEMNRTAAELAPEEKNAISHRGRALAALKRFLMSVTPRGAQ